MSASEHNECCPKFDPAPWDETEIQWQAKRFVKDRVTSFLHIPLNFGSVVQRNLAKIKAAGAVAEKAIMLADENSLWGADVYIEVARDVPDAQMATLSGTFVCKVFEGPYKEIPSWIKAMQAFMQSRSQRMQRLLFYYTTCPRCAKTYGKNYVVLLAQV